MTRIGFRALACLAAVAVTAACTTPGASIAICPDIKEYTAAQQDKVSAEMKTQVWLAPGGTEADGRPMAEVFPGTAGFLGDYHGLRDRIRACQPPAK
jgi:hypothetical protein